MTQTILIGDICTKVTSGGTPSTKHDEYYGGDIPWLRTQEVNFGNIYSTEKTITDIGLKNSSAKLIPENSVIIAMYGATAGKSAINKIPLSTNQACCNLIINHEKADYRYVYYYLFNNYDNLLKAATGAAQQNLGAKQIAAMSIDLPVLEMQKKIANILGTLDEKIELNLQMNETLEQMGQALFRHYFIDNPEAEKWSDGKFSDITGILTGKGSVKSQMSDSGEVPLYGANGIMGTSKDYLYDEPLVITGRVGTLGRVRAVTGQAWFSDNVLIMQPKSGSFGYVLHVAKSFDYISMNRGSSQPLITQTDLRNKQIKLPDSKTLFLFESQYKDVFDKQQKNEEQTQTLTALRDTLLPRLISGKIKV